MKIKKIFLSLLLVAFVLGCSREKNDFEKYEDVYKTYHKDGYEWKNSWYNYESIELKNYDSGIKTIEELKFVGKVQFNVDSFSGKTSEFILESKITEYSNEGIKIIETLDVFSEGILFSSETITDEEKNEKKVTTKGNEGLDNISIKFDFDKIIFNPVGMRLLNEEIDYAWFGASPDHLHFLNENYVKIDKIKSHYYSKKDMYISEYFFDDQFNFVKIKKAKRFYNDFPNYRIQQNATLEIIDEQKINPRQDYEETTTETVPNRLKREL